MDDLELGTVERAPGEAWLASRLGPEHAARRMRLEQAAEARGRRREAGRDRSLPALIDAVLPRILAASGMHARGCANAGRIQAERQEVAIEGLPEAFRGYTVLHITDLHADISPGAMRALPGLLQQLRCDICVITGDFRGRTYGPFARALDLVSDIVAAIPTPIFGVLGNHDPAAIVPPLETMGIRMLINECDAIERDGARLWVAGVDDPHRYRTHDVAKAMSPVPTGEPTILLAHSTECIQAAAASGADLMLCGHTHGGQICLPGSIPVLTSTRMPRRLASGSWREGRMQGYTSRGVGTSLVEARFSCPPEVTLHVLQPAGALVQNASQA